MFSIFTVTIHTLKQLGCIYHYAYKLYFRCRSFILFRAKVPFNDMTPDILGKRECVSNDEGCCCIALVASVKSNVLICGVFFIGTNFFGFVT